MYTHIYIFTAPANGFYLDLWSYINVLNLLLITVIILTVEPNIRMF